MSDGSNDPISPRAQIEGTYVLTSTTRYGSAFAPPGDKYTAFTNDLIEILRAGIPDAPELLSLSAIYDELNRRLSARGLPKPQFRADGAGGEFYFVRNAAFTFASPGDMDQTSTSTSLGPEPQSADYRSGAIPLWVDPGFAQEATRGQDLLGIRKDAVALAVLLASTSLAPPLALGLYGNWGSGKTFFMRALDREIQQLADQESSGFSSKVASVWFNAWQYAEGNLWASLTHHIFLCLHKDGSAPERVLDDALVKVQGVCDAKADAIANFERSEGAAKRARQELADLQRRNAEARKSAAKVRARDLLAAVTIDDQLRESLNQAARELGLPEAGATAREVVQAASDVRSAIERGRALSITGPWWRSPLVLGIAVALLVGGIGLAASLAIHARHGTLAPIVAEAGQLIALAGGAAAWITRQSSLVRSLMRPAERIQNQLNERLAEQETKYRAESAAAVDELNRTEAELTRARHQLAVAQEREAIARLDLSRLTGARLLKRYLSERAASSDYGQYLGAVALAHRDLRDLADYLQQSASEGDGPIDRIVLYIDDLDRCQPATVVQVLESVNLLLSLPLFVVVVGVDARWLMQSLQDVNPLLLSHNKANTNATPADYLDKIFQLSYQLPSMSVEACAELLEYTAVNTQPGNSNRFAHSANTLEPPEDASRSAPNSGGQSDEFQRSEAPDPRVDAIEATALELSNGELQELRAVAPLVGSSPRRAKRFLNIYRIIKARALMDPTTYDLLSEESARPSAATGLMILTALAVGLPEYMPAAIDAANRIDDMGLRPWLEEQNNAAISDPEEVRRLDAFLCYGSLPELPMREILAWLPMVRRFAWPVQPTIHPSPIQDSMERSAATTIHSGGKPKAPVFQHGSCPVKHRTAEAAARCRNP